MKRHNKAFTLVELIIVIAVIGVLAAILIPVFSNVVKKANAKSALSDARNTVEQIIVEAADNTAIPEHVVIFVKKAGNWYVYGYNRELGGEIQMSVGNPYSNFADVAAINSGYGWTGSEPTGSSYSIGSDGAFYLVTDPTNASAGFRGAGTRSVSGAVNVSSMMNETMGQNVEAYQGVLLPGTFTYDESECVGIDAEAGGSSTPSAEPFTVHYVAANEHVTSVPTDVTYPAGTTEVTIAGATVENEWYFLDYTTSITGDAIINENGVLDTSSVTGGTVTVTAVATGKTVTFFYSDGNYTNVQGLPTYETTLDLTDPEDRTITIDLMSIPTSDDGPFSSWVVMDSTVTLTGGMFYQLTGVGGMYIGGDVLTVVSSTQKTCRVPIQPVFGA